MALANRRRKVVVPKIVLRPYKNGLGGLSLIKEKLLEMGVPVIETKVHGSRYVPKPHHKQIQWGVPHGGKLNQLSVLTLSDVPVGDYTTEFAVAEQWVRDGSRVLCRTVLNGHGGAGIVVVQPNDVDAIVPAPLYVKYVPKQREFRVHCVKVGHEQWQYKVREKRRREGWQELEGFNKYVRNHDNGWVFCDNLRDNLPDEITDVSKRAVESLGLELGAVDIGYHLQHGYCVYEVNTAAGCDNATAQFYADCFKQILDGE